MKQEIKVPAMGESISEATIGTILKPSGSVVAADEEILELETDKVNQVLYAPQAGTVTLTVTPEQVVTIGQVIGYVESNGAAKTPTPSPTPAASPAQKTELPKAPSKSSPQARQGKEAFLADIRSKEETQIVPQLPQTPKREAPIKKEISSGERPETRRKMSKIRKVIASRLVDAQQTMALLTTFNEIDMSAVIGLREKHKESFVKQHGVKLGFLSFFVKAVVSALQECPDVNSYIDGDEIVHRDYFDIGIAVGTDRGLVVPVVRGCDQLTFAEIEQHIEALAAKAREGGLKVDDLEGGGFTITNGGVYGSLLSTPIVNPPQSGILGLHKIEKRVVVINDQVVIRPMMYVALSYDHRIIDGKEAVSFLVHIKNSLEDPSRMLLNL